MCICKAGMRGGFFCGKTVVISVKLAFKYEFNMQNVKFITISAKNSKKLDRLIFSCIINTRGLFSGPDSYFYTHR